MGGADSMTARTLEGKAFCSWSGFCVKINQKYFNDLFFSLDDVGSDRPHAIHHLEDEDEEEHEEDDNGKMANLTAKSQAEKAAEANQVLPINPAGWRYVCMYIYYTYIYIYIYI